MLIPPSPPEVRFMAGLFEDATGQRLGEDRVWRIEMTLTPLCRSRNICSLTALANRLGRSGEDVLRGEVIDALLNNETSFFRDPSAFHHLTATVLPQLRERRGREQRLRIWSAACSTGQEAYSLAMLFAEDPATWQGWTIEILGTDISGTAIHRARNGLYSQFEVQRGLPIRRLVDWFDPVLDEGWRVRPDLAGLVTFGRQNLLGPPPAGARFDLILCRNALLYFSADRRNEVLDRLAAAIAPDGALILGAGETPSSGHRFLADPDMLTIYRPGRPESRAA
jgi:chemotaxis protein methyltransferase CheR